MRALVVTLTVLFLGLSTSPASAYYRGSGTGAAVTTVASVPRAGSVTAAQVDEGVVHVAWTAATTSLGVTYTVRRQTVNGTSTVCTTTSTDCIDGPVPTGVTAYTVTASFRTWTTTSTAATITVTDSIPTVISFLRADPKATNLAEVAWDLVFSESVAGLAASNFTIDASGPTGAIVTAVTGGGRAWRVSATTGWGSGTLTPRLTSSAGATDATGTPIAVPVSGAPYDVRPFFPDALVLINGGSANRIDTGDSISIRFSLPPDPQSLCAAWTATGDHSSGAGSVALVDGGSGNDVLTFSLPLCPELHLGGIALGSTGFATAGTTRFAATITAVDRTVTVTLGPRTGTGSTGVVGGASAATFTPDAALRGSSGTAAVGSVVSTGRF